MFVYVGGGGKPFELKNGVSLRETVWDIKERIQDKTGLDPRRQRLYYAGHGGACKDDATLFDLDFRDATRVTIWQSLAGSGSHRPREVESGDDSKSDSD